MTGETELESAGRESENETGEALFIQRQCISARMNL